MIVFVLPTKNEAATIGDLLDGLARVAGREGWEYRALVVDDSHDATAAIAWARGALVMSGGRRGLGQAMLRGLARARALAPDWIVTLDTDGQVDLDELPEFYRVARERGADAVLSSRFLGAGFDYPYPWVNWIGNRLLVGILRLASGQRFTDSHGGIRWMRAEAVRDLRLIGRHTYVQETLIQMRRRGLKLVEVPSRWRERAHGDSRVLRSIPRYVWRTSPALLYWLRAHRLALVSVPPLLWAGLDLGASLAAGFGLAIAALPFFALHVDHAGS